MHVVVGGFCAQVHSLQESGFNMVQPYILNPLKHAQTQAMPRFRYDIAIARRVSADLTSKLAQPRQ